MEQLKSFSAQPDLTDIVFENRNKSYGAYYLRKHYNEHLRNAFLIAVGAVLLLLFMTELKFLRHKIVPAFADSLKEDTLLYPNIIIEIETPVLATALSTQENSSDNAQRKVVRDDNHMVPIDTISAVASTHGTGLDTVVGTASNMTTSTSGNNITSGENTSTGTDSFVIIPEVMPEFPGGEKALMKYLKKNVHYTNLAEQASATGKVVISFIVTKNGEIANAKVESDNAHYGLAEVALEVVKNMPGWSPGRNNDVPVNVRLVVPITFERQ